MMDAATLDDFLRDRRVAVLSIPRDGKAPLTTPIWYEYDGELFRLVVDATSAKAKLVGRTPDVPVSLAIQSEVPPYRYAVVYGRARLLGEGDAALRERLAHRYFGAVAGAQYLKQEQDAGRDAASTRVLEIRKERIQSHDFHPEAGWFGRSFFAVWRLFNPVPA
jgi:nitroimidazol reductase NimA-like FMN-containing flavoprotein (pyridoxamine 5'-phosphate oxidase superfamily)